MAGTATHPITYSESARLVQPSDWNGAWAVERAVSTTTISTTAIVTQRYYFLDASANAVVLTLPSAVGNSGLHFYVKCVNDTNGASVESADTIDGETSQGLDTDDCMEIVSDGTVWRVI